MSERCAVPVLPLHIHDLPSELLTKIFVIYWRAWTPPFRFGGSFEEAIQDSIQRLAHAPLMALSRVCSRWHAIALGTPSLWCEIQLDKFLWRPSKYTDKVMGLLQAALERGGESLLTVSITGSTRLRGQYPVLELLAGQSERWQTAVLRCSVDVLGALSHASGRLHRLENLEPHTWDDDPGALGILDALPRLQRLSFSGASAAISAVLLDQLLMLERLSLPEDVGMAMSAIPHLNSRAEFRLELDMGDENIPLLNLSPITSQIVKITIKIVNVPRLGDPQTVGEIFSSLTLPTLAELNLHALDHPGLPLRWPHPQFLAFAKRSIFHTHLVSFQLYHYELTHAEFLEALAILPALESLAIADNPFATPGGVEELLITDSLFAHLTASPNSESCLVPRLRSIRLHSLLFFSDTAYLAIVRSRVPASGSAHRFESHLCWLPGYHRPLDRGVVARMIALRAQKRLDFSFSEVQADTYVAGG
ncbi:hypothetical protein DFH09DRAFT_1191864 [Mycena vulgaris]|nr:hypothetical protein DFH09DRAFT_1191864 [Mycena vulgaris]